MKHATIREYENVFVRGFHIEGEDISRRKKVEVVMTDLLDQGLEFRTSTDLWHLIKVLLCTH